MEEPCREGRPECDKSPEEGCPVHLMHNYCKPRENLSFPCLDTFFKKLCLNTTLLPGSADIKILPNHHSTHSGMVGRQISQGNMWSVSSVELPSYGNQNQKIYVGLLKSTVKHICRL